MQGIKKYSGAFSKLVFLFILGAFLTGLLLGVKVLSDPEENSNLPSETSVDAGFARDMIAHHAQAVNMAFTIRDNTSDPTVRAIAYDIINTQSVQIGIMSGWLTQWGLPQTTTRSPMGWMPKEKMDQMHQQFGGQHSQMMGSMMPGMATEDELKQLKSAKGEKAEINFLKLMIRHHQGGVYMAETARDSATEKEVQNLARTIAEGQKAEIEAMQQMLKDRGKI